MFLLGCYSRCLTSPSSQSSTALSPRSIRGPTTTPSSAPPSSHPAAERTIQLVSLLVPEAPLHRKQKGVRPADPLHPWHLLGLKHACPDMGSVCACAQGSTSPPITAFGCLVPQVALGSPVPMQRHLSRIMCASQHK